VNHYPAKRTKAGSCYLEASLEVAKAEAASRRRHTSSIELYEKIKPFHAKNVAVAAIARHVGVRSLSVYRYLHMKHPPERTRIQYTRKKRDFAIQALLVPAME
jgi:hypothetical protein